MKDLIRHVLREHTSEIGEVAKMSPDEFIERAKQVHGDKYDYSETDYQNMRTKVKIICPEHGEFYQSPNHHLNGSGCTKCGNKKDEDKLKWNKDTIRNEAKKYNNLTDFFQNSGSAYVIAKKIGEDFFQSITSHMPHPKRWTDDELQDEAKKYLTRGEFQKNSNIPYQLAKNRGILDDICVHMEKVGHKYKRMVYVYEFPDNSVYVGLTYNPTQRHNSHMTKDNSAVYLHMKKTGMIPIKKSVTEYLDKNQASEVETKIEEKYRKDGWTILNRIKTGGLGGYTLLWTPEKIENEASKYDNLTDFYSNSPSAVNAAKRLGKDYYDNVISHMKRTVKWTEELLKQEAKKYKSRTDFARNNSKAYMAATRKGLLDKLFPKK